MFFSLTPKASRFRESLPEEGAAKEQEEKEEEEQEDDEQQKKQIRHTRVRIGMFISCLSPNVRKSRNIGNKLKINRTDNLGQMENPFFKRDFPFQNGKSNFKTGFPISPILSVRSIFNLFPIFRDFRKLGLKQEMNIPSLMESV